MKPPSSLSLATPRGGRPPAARQSRFRGRKLGGAFGLHTPRSPGSLFRAYPTAQRGFTLIEAVISAGLIGFLAVTATYFWVDNLSLVRSVDADSAAVADGRAALERLAREIREVKFAGTGFCISTLAATQLVFNKTVGTVVPSCGGATPDGTRGDIAVSVALNGSTLNLGYAGSLAQPAVTRALTTQASAFSIRYLDSAYAVTASLSAMRFVELTLTVQPPGGQATQTRALVGLRNE